MTWPCSTDWRGSSIHQTLLRRPDVITANRRGQPGLWPHAISGDRPIVLVQVAATDDESLVRQLVQWTLARGRGLNPDLVILDGPPAMRVTGSRPNSRAGPAALLGKRSGILLLARNSSRPRTGCCSPAASPALSLVAVTRLPGGSHSPQSSCGGYRAATVMTMIPVAAEPAKSPPVPPEGTSKFWNGYEGIPRLDGREYVIVIDGTARGGPALPPAPVDQCAGQPPTSGV